METTHPATCPFCGHRNEIAIDSEVHNQEFMTDCEVCCRPFLVRAQCEGGEVVYMDVSSE